VILIFAWWDMFPQNIKFNSTIPFCSFLHFSLPNTCSTVCFFFGGSIFQSFPSTVFSFFHDLSDKKWVAT